MDASTEEMILFPCLGLLAGWFLWLVFRRIRLDQEAKLRQLDLQKEIARKFDSAESFTAFLKTEEGRRCFPATADPRVNLIRSIAWGAVLMLAGLVMLGNGYSWRNYDDINFVNKMRDYYYWGSLTISAGIGLILHAWLRSFLFRRITTK